MARVSIYVPDGLKAAMDEIGDDRINWSGVAQRAFEASISQAKWPKEPQMENVIERLRTSKAEEALAEQASGYNAGREWAVSHASYSELKTLSELDMNGAADGEYYLLVDRALGYGDDGPDSSFWSEPDQRRFVAPTDEYVSAFAMGADEVWQQVADKI